MAKSNSGKVKVAGPRASVADAPVAAAPSAPVKVFRAVREWFSRHRVFVTVLLLLAVSFFSFVMGSAATIQIYETSMQSVNAQVAAALAANGVGTGAAVSGDPEWDGDFLDTGLALADEETGIITLDNGTSLQIADGWKIIEVEKTVPAVLIAPDEEGDPDPASIMVCIVVNRNLDAFDDLTLAECGSVSLGAYWNETGESAENPLDYISPVEG